MMIIFFFFLVLANVAFGGENKNEEPRVKDAFLRNAQIGRGVNLGNALEAPKEGEWGVRLEEGYFDLIRKAGFTSVRIPVRWSAHALDEPPYTIDKSFFDRVDWAVSQTLSKGLIAIINIHHYEKLVELPPEHKKRFPALWKQISEHYKDQPDSLFFELLNEPCKKMTSDLWNEYLVEAINLIRTTNPTRIIIVGPANWNNISELKSLKLPPDERNIIVTFHYYSPFHFTHQGASWVGEQSKSWLGTQWLGTEKEKQDVISDLERACQWSKDNNRPLYMGEFGAYEKADMQSRVKWASFVRSEAEKRGISWAWWEFCAGFGVYDKDKKVWRTDLLHSLIPPKQEIK